MRKSIVVAIAVMMLFGCSHKLSNPVGKWSGTASLKFSNQDPEVVTLDVMPNKQFNIRELGLQGTWEQDSGGIKLHPTKGQGGPIAGASALFDNLFDLKINESGKHISSEGFIVFELDKKT